LRKMLPICGKCLPICGKCLPICGIFFNTLKNFENGRWLQTLCVQGRLMLGVHVFVPVFVYLVHVFVRVFMYLVHVFAPDTCILIYVFAPSNPGDSHHWQMHKCIQFGYIYTHVYIV
jgi:hypothetical protein